MTSKQQYVCDVCGKPATHRVQDTIRGVDVTRQWGLSTPRWGRRETVATITQSKRASTRLDK